jgi:hypothetical protein
MHPYSEDRGEMSRAVIAVGRFETRGDSSGIVAENMRALFLAALRRDGRFAMAHSASDAEESNADYVIDGVVARYQTEQSGHYSQRAEVEFLFRVLDPATGEEIGRVHGFGSGSGPDGGFSDRMDVESFRDTALGRAGSAALRQAVPKLADLISGPEQGDSGDE